MREARLQYLEMLPSVPVCVVFRHRQILVAAVQRPPLWLDLVDTVVVVPVLLGAAAAAAARLL